MGSVGFKSMLDTFISRTKFEYGIPSLDKLLKTDAIPDSFLLYDEQILQILKAAGIPGPDAYACTKSIKKKRYDKVLSYKEKFKTGFTQYLKETENASEEKASEVVEEVWTIIENAASYMFLKKNLHAVIRVENTVNWHAAKCRLCG